MVAASTYRGNSCSKGKDGFGRRDVEDVVNLSKVLPHFSKADTSHLGMMGLAGEG